MCLRRGRFVGVDVRALYMCLRCRIVGVIGGVDFVDMGQWLVDGKSVGSGSCL